MPLLFSVIIEAVQYVTGFGVCEFDDIISNVLGSLIGFEIGSKLENMLRKNMRSFIT